MDNLNTSERFELARQMVRDQEYHIQKRLHFESMEYWINGVRFYVVVGKYKTFVVHFLHENGRIFDADSFSNWHDFALKYKQEGSALKATDKVNWDHSTDRSYKLYTRDGGVSIVTEVP